jgi:hypothetical protein
VFNWLSNCVYFCKEIKGSHKGYHLLSYYLIKTLELLLLLLLLPLN